ncbi:hypothetical protein BV898_01765 [Hypsibius exemplaris]|uniref:HECT domain-containing protein n=1 Tax=Hypsibius exemplaris TaxID=2072580 RepID=A0A1W0XAC3_HYPEX|nr:hypothetical protein BV898_01765 [Hypsibius exemplaris]
MIAAGCIKNIVLRMDSPEHFQDMLESTFDFVAGKEWKMLTTVAGKSTRLIDACLPRSGHWDRKSVFALRKRSGALYLAPKDQVFRLLLINLVESCVVTRPAVTQSTVPPRESVIAFAITNAPVETNTNETGSTSFEFPLRKDNEFELFEEIYHRPLAESLSGTDMSQLPTLSGQTIDAWRINMQNRINVIRLAQGDNDDDEALLELDGDKNAIMMSFFRGASVVKLAQDTRMKFDDAIDVEGVMTGTTYTFWRKVMESKEGIFPLWEKSSDEELYLPSSRSNPQTTDFFETIGKGTFFCLMQKGGTFPPFIDPIMFRQKFVYRFKLDRVFSYSSLSGKAACFIQANYGRADLVNIHRMPAYVEYLRETTSDLAPFSNLRRDGAIEAIVRHELFGSRRANIEAFFRGFDQNHTVLRIRVDQMWAKMERAFFRHVESPHEFMENLAGGVAGIIGQIDLEDLTSEERESQQRIFLWFCDYINVATSTQLKDALVFITGSSTIPVVPHITVTFADEDRKLRVLEGRLPTAHNCGKVLTLCRSYGEGDEEAAKKDFEIAFRANEYYGLH